MNSYTDQNKFDVCIVGGGPAGMITALGLLRRGRKVMVVEKNPDFAREFRGEVLQPRFWRAVERAGMLDAIASFNHERFSTINFFSRGRIATSIPVSKISPTHPFISWMTQPTLLNGLYQECRKHSGFEMLFDTNVDSLRYTKDFVSGINLASQGSSQSIDAKIIIGADGRFSKLRKLANLPLRRHEHHFDVIWFETERPADLPNSLYFFIDAPIPCLVLPKYPNLIQAGFLVHPNQAREVLRRGDDYLVDCVEQTHPLFKGVARQLINRQHYTVLSGVVDMLDTWARDGLLMIGDAAHTCSPAGAIGVTIATETAVCAIDVVDAALTRGDYSADALSQVQRLRMPDIERVHALQRRAARIVNAPRWARSASMLAVQAGNALGFVAPLAARILR